MKVTRKTQSIVLALFLQECACVCVKNLHAMQVCDYVSVSG